MLFKKISLIFCIYLTIALLIISAYLFWFVNHNISSSMYQYNIPYFDKETCVGVLLEESVIYVNINLTAKETEFYCYKEYDKRLNDNFSYFSNKIYKFEIDRTAKVSYPDIENVVNTLGGIPLLDEEGNTFFAFGQQVVSLIKSKDALYVSYLFGEIVKNLIEQKSFNTIYDLSDISLMDITNNYDDILSSLRIMHYKS